MLVDGTMRADDFEMVLGAHLDTHHDEQSKAAMALLKVGDSLPGLGIVAAVLGIVITMQHVAGKPEEIGHHVAVALVGTFLGIFLSYGYVQPLAANMENQADADSRFLLCIKNCLVAFARGAPPLVAVEVARHVIWSDDRPDSRGAVRGLSNCREPRGMKGDQAPRPRIIVKKAHGGHHGGAWKVAYADFVTTMMALFIVLWITSQNAGTREAVAQYFKDPGTFKVKSQPSMIPGSTGLLPGQPVEGPGGAQDPAAEEQALQQAAEQFRDALDRAGMSEAPQGPGPDRGDARGTSDRADRAGQLALLPRGQPGRPAHAPARAREPGARRRQAAEPHHDRRPYRQPTVQQQRGLLELGAVHRPDEQRPPGHGSRRPHAGTHRPPRGACRPDATAARRSPERHESPHHHARAPPGAGSRRSGSTRCRRYWRSQEPREASRTLKASCLDAFPS